MEIIFNSTKFEKECGNYRLLVKRHGSIRARRIINRLDDLRYANVLEDMRRASGRCHELRGNRAGQLSLDLDHPYRLVFEPDHEPIPRKDDGGLDWTQITAVVIIGVEDTHE